jgi:transcriptional regulator with XRE-family HTH domain
MVEQDTAPSRTPLSDLVRERRKELGISTRTLAERCIDPDDPESGSLWTRGTLENLEKGVPITPPALPRLKALAEGLRLPLRTVRDAAGEQFMGIKTVRHPSKTIRALIDIAEEMPEEDQAKLLSVGESWLDMLKKRGDQG